MNPLKTAFDLVWEGHENDSIDLIGPALFGTEGSVADSLTRVEGEDRSGDRRNTLIVGFVAVLAVLYVLGPYVEVLTD